MSSLKFYLQSVSSDWDVLVRSDRERGVLAIIFLWSTLRDQGVLAFTLSPFQATGCPRLTFSSFHKRPGVLVEIICLVCSR